MAPATNASDAGPQGRMVVLGHVSGAYGVKGWVRIHSHTAPRDAILDYRPWFLGRAGHWREVECIEGRRQAKGLVARIDGVDDRDAAQALVGSEIAVPRARLGDTASGEYYWVDLEGLEVVTPGGRVLGVIDHLFETGANDVMVVKGEQERLIPFVEPEVVREVDFEARRVVVDWDADF